jgi:ATP-dependent DNA helicase RecQ
MWNPEVKPPALHAPMLFGSGEAPALAAARAAPGARPTMEQALAALRAGWGYPAFHPHQAYAIARVLEGRDLLSVVPTGGGKSLTYQIPALVVPSGVTLVVSPLISLMKDQIDGLVSRGSRRPTSTAR